VVRTRVGYAGGRKVKPTYHDLGDHSETIEIDFDPTRTSYRELLDVFWASHSPVQPSYSLQYASRIFYHSEEQRQMAEESRLLAEAAYGRKLHTSIEPATQFYLAEDYHQKYYLQGQVLLAAEVREIYPDLEGFVNSTLAARLNGYVGGRGSREQLDAELDSYGLSEQAVTLLRSMVR
jgi:peptide-methionine (S)-S-oxide reductase